MSLNKPIRQIAIVGTGVIGASWAAQYLVRGFEVIATDPAPNAEANLRKYIDEAWKDLTAIGFSEGASRDRLIFTTTMKDALSKADLIQENGPERADSKIKLTRGALSTSGPANSKFLSITPFRPLTGTRSHQ
jgi:3-hydroxyacyl-CoA dehydrogenase